VVVAASYVLAVLAPLPTALFTAGSPVTLADVPELARLQEPLLMIGRLLSVVVAVLLVQRVRTTPPAQRRSLGPLYVYGAAATLAISFAGQLQALFQISPETRFVLQSLALAVIPVAFTTVLLRGGFGRAGAVEELSSLLSTEQAPTQDVLARVLGDPSLELLHWLPADRTWVDGEGRARTPPSDPRRGLVEVTIAGRRAGALTYDALLLSDPDLVRLAARPAGLALEAERLTVELRRSRARLVAAADDERRRLARDLHDGLQVRLVLLAMEAGTASATAPDPASSEALQRVRHGVDEAAAELRRTVHSLLPAALVERGLGPAVEDLVDRLPLPARLQLQQVPPDLAPGVVTTAWYVVTEGLTNALKHADASSLDVELRAADGRLLVTVGDDGSGGASLQQGSGLRGLVDRLDVVGGRLHLDSPAGGGTRVRAEIPLAA
jgi:signal transduction histidine kinase